MLAVAEKIEINEVHICCNCGNTGAGMVRFNEYVGGRGMVEVWECRDCLEHVKEESSRAVEALDKKMALIGAGA